MSEENPALLAHLLTRRTVPAARLVAPAPDPDQLATMLKAAVRVPDHGKLAPWRFIMFADDQREAFTDRLMALWRAAHADASEQAESVERGKLDGAPLLVAVVSRAAPHPKIPEWEQVLSAGAACMNLVTAAHALGFGANWVTGWPAYDRSCLDLLGVAENERVAGFVHIGTPKAALEDRPRPKLEDIVTEL
jgi:nitroreductase